MSRILRHTPEEFELTLDAEGYVSIQRLQSVIASQPKFGWATMQDLIDITRQGDKPRFEIHGNRIRARWGHSTEGEIQYAPAEPPQALYHGTARRRVGDIRQDGLCSMARQYVHLSTDAETALRVGQRHDPCPVILLIRAQDAWRSQIVFHNPHADTWLAKQVPPEFIEVPED